MVNFFAMMPGQSQQCFGDAIHVRTENTTSKKEVLPGFEPGLRESDRCQNPV